MSVRNVAFGLAALALAACATPVAEPPMAKGYIIADVAVTDATAYEAYRDAVAPLIAQFGGRYLVRGGQTDAKEGAAPGGRVVVIEFESLAAAQRFWNSPEYRAIVDLRTRNATSRIFLVEGVTP